MSAMTHDSTTAMKMQCVIMLLGATSVSVMKVMREMGLTALVSVLKNYPNIFIAILKVKLLGSCLSCIVYDCLRLYYFLHL